MEALEARRLMALPPPPNGDGFTYQMWYPEGFAGAAVNEFVPIVNPGEAAGRYRLWAHYETGERDELIAEGFLGAGQRGGVTVSDTSGSLVRPGEPYALRLESEVALAASVSRYDRGATGEAMTSRTADEWVLANVYRGIGRLNNFVVWQNTSTTDADVTVTFTRVLAQGEDIPNIPNPVTVTVRTGAMRRGGLAIDELAQIDSLGRGVGLVAVVRANATIVAAVSSYDEAGGGTYTSLGTRYGPSSHWTMPAVTMDPEISDRVIVFNPSTETTTASVAARFADGTATEIFDALRLEPGRAIAMPLITLLGTRLPGEVAAVTVVGDSEVYAAAVSRGTTGDGGSTPAYPDPGTALGASLHFAEGFIDPARTDVTETLAISNFGFTLTVQNTVTVRLRFADASTWETSVSIAPGATAVLVLSDNDDLKRTIEERGQYFFSIEVLGDFFVSAALRHTDGGFGGDASEIVLLGEPIIEVITAG